MRSIFKWLGRERGQSILLVAVSIAMLCGVAALVVDIGMISVSQGQLQNAADAAALAAASDLPSANTARNTALKYADLNGVPAERTTVTTPYSGSANKVEVVCKETVQYTFARVLGLDSIEVSARAVAEKSGTSSGPFGYALFTGGTGTMGVYTASIDITGSVHANGSVQMSGSDFRISGNAEAVNQFAAYVAQIIIGGTCQATSIVVPQNGNGTSVPIQVSAPATFIDMPNLAAEAKAEAIAAGTYYEGDLNFYGTNHNVDSAIFVNGNINVSGSSFTGKGMICATGNINFYGDMIKSSSDSAVCIYSVNGNIMFSASGVSIDGTLYAPNGSINIYMANTTINGRVVAKDINISGSGVKITAGETDLGFLSGSGGGTVSLVE